MKKRSTVNVAPARNDGKTVHKLTLKDVPIDGFWSISVDDFDGRFAPNPQKAFTVNSVTVEDGTRRLGRSSSLAAAPARSPIACRPRPTGVIWSACTGPRPEILNGAWTLPAAAAGALKAAAGGPVFAQSRQAPGSRPWIPACAGMTRAGASTKRNHSALQMIEQRVAHEVGRVVDDPVGRLRQVAQARIGAKLRAFVGERRHGELVPVAP